MINRELVKGRLVLIVEYLGELKKLSRLSEEEFLEDKRNTAAAESYLRRSLEAIFDIGRHILAKTGGVEMASEYKSIATGLGEKKVVDADLSQTLFQMAGYRNRLVYLYHIISSKELYAIINDHLEDIEKFITQVNEYLDVN